MDQIKPSKNLRGSIIATIGQSERKRARLYLLVSAAVFCLSGLALVWATKYLLTSFGESGFYEYLSLLFSGDSTVLAYWKELAYSLLETLPILGTTAFLAAIGFFVWSGSQAIIQIRRFSLISA